MKYRNALVVAVAVAATLLGTAPALAATTAGSAMMIADISRDVDALTSGSHTSARVVSAAYAEFPAFERMAGRGATIRVVIDLDAAGRLTAARVGTASASVRFDAAALAAVRSSTFAPATVNGRGVPGTYAVDVTFDPER